MPESFLGREMEQDTATAEQGGEFLTFFLGPEEYAIPILAVKEIAGIQTVTAVPQAPAYLRGVANLRGTVIPILDLRSWFQMESRPDTEETCVIVLHRREQTVGVVVDRVWEVRGIPEEDIVDAPSLTQAQGMKGILGIGKSRERVTLLLKMDALPLSSTPENPRYLKKQ